MVKKEEAMKNTEEKIEEVNKTEDNASTVTMQGVSGKTITSKVKVFKANKREKPVETQDESKAAPAATVTPSVTAQTTTTTAQKGGVAGSAPNAVEATATTPTQKVAAPAAADVAAPKQAKAELSSDPATPAVSAEASSEPMPRKLPGKKVLPPQAQKVAKTKVDATPLATSQEGDTAAPALAQEKVSTVKKAPERPLTQRPPKEESPVKRPASEAKAAPAAQSAASEAEKTVAAPAATKAPAAQASTPKTAAPAGPRKLGNIFDQMKLNKAGGAASGGPSKLEKSGLAATAAAFARRQEDQKNRGAEGERRSFQRGPGYSNGAYNAGGGYNRGGGSGGQGGYTQRPRPEGGGYRGRPGQGFATGGGFDKDKDEDKPVSRPRKAPAKKKGPEGIDLFAPKSSKPASSFSARDAIDKNKARDGRTPRSGMQQQRRRTSFAQDMDGEFGNRRGGRRPKRDTRKLQPVAVLTQVSLPEVLTVKEFAEAIKKTSAEVIKSLIKFGEMATLNQNIDYDTASIIAGEFGIKTEKIIEVTEEDILFDDTEENEADLLERPPVVAVMGHVDHGKTSLLDYIRHAHVASGEAGGITQHIGAYMVRVNNRKITFLDTPGHEAFTTMRARGAQATDIAILVVAADDGVMPQTIEAINHAKAANTTIVVAINKMDKPGANVDRVKQELAAHDVVSEDWGGSTVMVPVSAKTGEGIEELLEMLLLTADILDLKANPNAQAKGIVIEAKLDKSRGALATVLVQRGTLHQGDTLVTGAIVGNVRAMTDASGNTVKKAGPSVPVEILGLPDVPEAGELFYVVEDEKIARQLAEKRRIVQRETAIHGSSRMTLDNLFSKMAAGEVKDLNIIVKADVVGSVEAVRQSLEKLSNDEVRVQVIHQAVGAITETDIRLAEVSDAIVIGFNVRPVNSAAEMAKESGVDVRLYRVIYSAIEDIEAAMKGMLDPEFKEHVTGHIEIRETYKVSNVGTIGGAYVTDGKVHRNSQVRLVRDGVVIHEGKLGSLRRFKDDVREVAAGYECGISLENYNDIKIGDVIEAFEMKEVER